MEKAIDWDSFQAASEVDEEPDYETSLIRAAAAGDEEAFRQVVEAYQDRIYRVAYQWLGSVEDAQEVTQDTFVRAYLALGRYTRQGKFSTWLYKITLNLCRDRAKSREFRNRAATTPLKEVVPSLVSTEKNPGELALQKEALHEIGQGISILPEKLRSVVVLAVFEGLSHEQCGTILGCSARAVEGRLHRARKMLTDWLERAASSGK